MPPAAPPPSTAALVTTATVFYALMTLFGVGLIAAQELPFVALIFGAGERVLRDTLVGAGAGIAVVVLTWVTRDLGPMKQLTDELRSMLGRPGSGAIAVLAVTSAVGEEVFFRGALQPLIGFWPTVIVFGFLHGGTQKKLRSWAIFATLAGILLGWLAEFTGNLLAPVLCHLTVNFFNLHALIDSNPETTAS